MNPDKAAESKPVLPPRTASADVTSTSRGALQPQCEKTSNGIGGGDRK